MMQKLWINLVRLGFRLLYYEMAWTYDVVSWAVSLGHWRKWQQAALPFVQGQRVLEIGHGPGHMLLALRQLGYEVVGLDLSPQMGRMARMQVGDAVALVRGSVQGLPWGSAVFDTVFSTFPTNYIVDPVTIAEVKRVLRGNGRLVIVPEGHLTNTGWLYSLIEWLFKITGQRSEPFDFSEAELWQDFTHPFRAAGFRTEIHPIQLEGSVATIIVALKE
jgi:ubiquinone/menaquinone biosynthesis C-methylase UbiE